MPELNRTILKNSANLKAYYRFESGALTTDSSGNSHTLTAVSDPAETTGVFGGGVAIDSNDCYTITDHADWKPTGAFTVGAWVKHASDTGNYAIVSSYSQNSAVAGWVLGMNATASGVHKASFISGKNTGTTANVDYAVAVGTTTIDDGNWHQIVGTSDGTTLRLYVDGKHDGANGWANAPVYAATNYVRIGSEVATGANTKFWLGDLDDVFLLNGTALSADQIKELYEGRIYGELRPNQFGTTVGLWHLNGNSTDFSGNNNHGTDTSITYSAANGKLGQGADFNGSNGRIQVADSASLSITGNYTLGLWANIDALPSSGGFSCLLNKYDVLSGGTLNTGFDFRLYNDSGTQKVEITHGAAGGTPSASVAKSLPTGTWIFLVGVYNGTTLKIYQDGAEIATTNTTVNPADNSKALNFGNFGYYTPSAGELGRYFNGKMDEVFISSTALTATQIRQIYAYQKGLLGRF